MLMVMRYLGRSFTAFGLKNIKKWNYVLHMSKKNSSWSQERGLHTTAIYFTSAPLKTIAENGIGNDRKCKSAEFKTY